MPRERLPFGTHGSITLHKTRAVCDTADSSHYTGSRATRKRFRHRAGASPNLGVIKPRRAGIAKGTPPLSRMPSARVTMLLRQLASELITRGPNVACK